MSTKPFKILSIDGGGIRGVFPAMFLTKLEEKLKAEGKEKWQIYQNFDLIVGTSTGGIIAIALALGIPAKELYELYLNKAKDIFGHKKNFFKQVLYASHERETLEKLIKSKFKEVSKDDKDPVLKDCKTNICIPAYDLLEGKPSVIKNKYHHRFTRDYHIPAYKVALATSSAPTYFNPYSTKYIDLNGTEQSFSNKVDGGVFANNPALIGIMEAKEAFKKELPKINVLSLGTGYQTFSEGQNRKKWGIHYWILKDKKRRLIDLFMQGQSQMVENIIGLMQNGIDREREKNPSFIYHRINTQLNSTLNIAMDETSKDKLEKLAEKASNKFHDNANNIIKTFCS